MNNLLNEGMKRRTEGIREGRKKGKQIREGENERKESFVFVGMRRAMMFKKGRHTATRGKEGIAGKRKVLHGLGKRGEELGS